MTARWPGDLPPLPAANGESHSPQNNRVSFRPDIGPSIDRRRGTAAGRQVSVTLPALSLEQYNVFLEFVHECLFDGVLPFDWYSPRDYCDYRYKFTGDDKLYSADLVDGRYWRVTFTLLRLP